MKQIRIFLCLLLVVCLLRSTQTSVRADGSPVGQDALPGTAPARSIVEWFQDEGSGHCGVFRRDGNEGSLDVSVDGYYWQYDNEDALWTDYESHRNEFLAAHSNCGEGYYPDPDFGGSGSDGRMDAVDEGSLPGTVPTGSTVEWFVDEENGQCGIFPLDFSDGSFDFGGDGHWWQYDNAEALSRGHEDHRQAFFDNHPRCHDGI